jgi:hypothetical protein
VVPLLRAEGGEEESQFGLVVPEDIRATEAERVNCLFLTMHLDGGLTCWINSTRARGSYEAPRWIRALVKEIGLY